MFDTYTTPTTLQRCELVTRPWLVHYVIDKHSDWSQVSISSTLSDRNTWFISAQSYAGNIERQHYWATVTDISDSGLYYLGPQVGVHNIPGSKSRMLPLTNVPTPKNNLSNTIIRAIIASVTTYNMHLCVVGQMIFIATPNETDNKIIR